MAINSLTGCLKQLNCFPRWTEAKLASLQGKVDAIGENIQHAWLWHHGAMSSILWLGGANNEYGSYQLTVLAGFLKVYIRHRDGMRVSFMSRCYHAAWWTVLTLWGLTMTGCAVMQPEVAVSTPCACEEQQQEISRLQQMLAEKEAEINRLQAHQQDQKKELEETTSEAARAEIKLRRFATEADVASRLAEVEVAMEVLQSKLGAEHQVPLQVLAQQLPRWR